MTQMVRCTTTSETRSGTAHWTGVNVPDGRTSPAPSTRKAWSACTGLIMIGPSLLLDNGGRYAVRQGVSDLLDLP
jgi:hypothetical protein